MRQTLLNIFGYLTLLYLVTACASNEIMTRPDTKASSLDVATKNKLYVYYNNDNFAYLEPCGCRISPIGSMARRWNAMKPVPVEQRIFVDAGNLLYKSTNPPEYLQDQWRVQAEGVIEAYNILHVDAATPGETDFALGVENFLELRKKAKFAYVSANLFKKNGEQLLPSHVLIEKMGIKIGIFGIYGNDIPLSSELMLKDPIATSEKEISSLRSAGADFIIMLSHQGYDADIALAKNISGIDLIVGAHSQSLLQTPEKIQNTTIVQLSSQGQMLGYLEYLNKDYSNSGNGGDRASSYGGENKIIQMNSVVAELGSEFDEVKSSSSTGVAALRAPDANPMKALVAITNLRIAEVNKKLDEKIWAKEAASELSFGASVKGKATKRKTGLLSADSGSAKLKTNSSVKKNTAPMNGVPISTSKDEKYKTFLGCRDCHQKQARKIEGTPHAAAYLTLIAKNEENNLDCIKCHSIGLGEKKGFRGVAEAIQDKNGKPVPLEKILSTANLSDLRGSEISYRILNEDKIYAHVEKWISGLKKSGAAKAFIGVQCESCHGDMGAHPRELAGLNNFSLNTKTQSANKIKRAVQTHTCLQCHTEKQMPAWYKDGKVLLDRVEEEMKRVGCGS